jgi:hypothetical protein
MNKWALLIFAAVLSLLIPDCVWAQELHVHASSKQLESGHLQGKPANVTVNKDSAVNDPPKSWARETQPTAIDKQFLNSLTWRSQPIGSGYNLRTGIIFDKWIAAMQFTKNGKTVLTEYTPPQEYVTIIDPISGEPCADVLARDVNDDGVLEIAFLHRKLYDANYHMYTVYALTPKSPKLLWKSAGKLGNWSAKHH